MKIGITTFSLSDNAGAMLQLFALYHFLSKDKNNKVFVVNYDNYLTYMLQMPIFQLKQLLKNFKTIFKNDLLYCVANHFNYQQFRNKMLFSKPCFKRTKLHNNKPHYDLAIFGSDQILHFPLTNYDLNYLNGDNILIADEKIMFSGSIGSYKPATNAEWHLFKKAFNELNGISFREKKTKELFSKINVASTLTCDPTLLINSDEWMAFIKHSNNNRFVYLYYATDVLLSKAIEYAKQNNLTIYYSYPLIKMPKCKNIKRVKDDPISFLNYIYHADYVFTSSYHCLMFSLIFNKRCFCPVDKNDARFDRLIDLIDGLDLYKCLSLINNQKPNYDIYKKKQDLIQQSKDYLSSFIYHYEQ